MTGHQGKLRQLPQFEGFCLCLPGPDHPLIVSVLGLTTRSITPRDTCSISLESVDISLSIISSLFSRGNQGSDRGYGFSWVTELALVCGLGHGSVSVNRDYTREVGLILQAGPSC